MPVLCCGSTSVEVDQTGTRPTGKIEDDENNNEGERQSSEVVQDPEYAQATPGQSNGLVKSSQHKMKYEVNPDPDTSATTSAGKETSSSTTRASKRGKKLLPKRKGSSPSVPEEPVGERSSEKVSERSTPPKKKTGKKSSFRETEEMEMSPLDPGFYNSTTLQASRQLYAQQTFEEEDDDVLENVEEERRKNKHRQRMKKKQSGSAVSAQPPAVDTMQAAYERAQQEIDKVLGPRNANPSAPVPGAIAGDRDKRRSRRHHRKGQVNEAYRDDDNGPAPVLAPSESLEEVKSRVHALLDDAFSLISSSYTSIGNRVAPASPSKQEVTEAPAVKESESTLAKSPPAGNMPAVEEVHNMSLAPKRGEKLHMPVLVDRTYGDYDADGLITWSPYRAADESARIVLPESQPPVTKAAAQEKLQTTTFMESATSSGPHHHHQHPPPHAQPIIIRTRPHANPTTTQPKTDSSHTADAQRASTRNEDGSRKGSAQLAATAESDISYTPYPGLQTYEDMLGEATTTTAHFTAAPASSEDPDTEGEPLMNGDVDNTSEVEPPTHQPPTRNVGSRDERDFIASRMGAGTSPKELVDSIRQELQSLSGKLPQADEAPKGQQSLGNGNPKPLKKARKSSYLDST